VLQSASSVVSIAGVVKVNAVARLHLNEAQKGGKRLVGGAPVLDVAVFLLVRHCAPTCAKLTGRVPWTTIAGPTGRVIFSQDSSYCVC
jgi:hypothetical protein